MSINSITLPITKKGRKSKADQALFDAQLQEFADAVKKIDDKLEDKVSSRGWAYLLETFNVIDKSQFDYIQKLINICRKNGMLPIDFVTEDENRSWKFVEDLNNKDYMKPYDFVLSWLKYYRNKFNKKKDDFTFWEKQDYYIQMIAEKIDVITISKKLCKKYHIPLANGKGWPDLNMRNNLAQRFKEAEKQGKKCVLLYYGDFDPVGKIIAEKYYKLLKDLELATGYNPDNLIIDAFGLSEEFIKENNITWIDNLITGSGKKADKSKQYIRDYIAKYGERKVEANAIIVPKIRAKYEQELEGVILKYLGEDPLSDYQDKIKEETEETQEWVEAIDWENTLDDLIEKFENL